MGKDAFCGPIYGLCVTTAVVGLGTLSTVVTGLITGIVLSEAGCTFATADSVALVSGIITGVVTGGRLLLAAVGEGPKDLVTAAVGAAVGAGIGAVEGDTTVAAVGIVAGAVISGFIKRKYTHLRRL